MYFKVDFVNVSPVLINSGFIKVLNTLLVLTMLKSPVITVGTGLFSILDFNISSCLERVKLNKWSK